MNKLKLFIVGCGNVGGFVAYNFTDFNLQEFEIAGFLDDDIQKWGKTFFGYSVLGGIDMLNRESQPIGVVVSIANPQIKRKIIQNISAKNILFPKLVSSRAWISQKVEVGQGVIIYPGVSVNYQTVIEDFVIINMNSAVGHDCRLGKFTTLAPGICLAGSSYLGECVDMGINSSTKRSISIGENTIIGGMAMVTKDIPNNVVALGIPARIIGH